MDQMARIASKIDEKSMAYEVFEGFFGHQKQRVIPGINCREVVLVQLYPAEKSWQKKLPFSLA